MGKTLVLLWWLVTDSMVKILSYAIQGDDMQGSREDHVDLRLWKGSEERSCLDSGEYSDQQYDRCELAKMANEGE
jgi:hypothetical protein